MSMHYETHGNVRDASRPLLFCIPGLMGGVEDFRQMMPELLQSFAVVIADPNRQRRLSTLTEDDLQEISYASTAEGVAEILDEIDRPQARFIGLSLGGKIIYDFVARYPERFAGGVVTDVGLGAFNDSDLYRFVDVAVNSVPMHLPWDALKQALRQAVPDRSMRSLIQSQVHYPTGAPPAQWKVGMRHFRNIIHGQGLDDQFEAFARVGSRLESERKFLHVLKAENCSGIDEASHARMREIGAIRFDYVRDASHFLHITHKERVLEALRKSLAHE